MTEIEFKPRKTLYKIIIAYGSIFLIALILTGGIRIITHKTQIINCPETSYTSCTIEIAGKEQILLAGQEIVLNEQTEILKTLINIFNYTVFGSFLIATLLSIKKKKN
jgi:hypothetical protein